MKEGGAERAPMTGVDRVFKEALYANLRFPQTGSAILGYTLNALFTDPNPQKLIPEYINTKLSKEKVARLVEAADRAHAAYLPEGERPVVTAEGIQEIYGSFKENIQGFIRDILEHGATSGASLTSDEAKAYTIALIESHELPLEEIRKTLEAYMKVFKSPDIQERLVAFRNSYKDKESKSKGYVDQIESVVKLKREMESRMIADLSAGGTLSELQNKIIHFLFKP